MQSLSQDLRDGARRLLKPSLHTWIALLIWSALVVVAPPVTTQSQEPSQSDLAIDAATRAAVIEGTLKKLNENYIFPEIAQKMEQAVRARLANKEYDSVTNAETMAQTLTTHLREVSRDLHLKVNYSRAPLPIVDVTRPPSPEAIERQRRNALFVNFGFERVERLAGNVGYLDLRSFEQAAWAGETAVAALNFLANTDALIIDLRNNGGGSPETVAVLSSYLFDQATHLNSIYWRPNDSTRQFWTSTHVEGQRYGGKKDVYVLTSRRTFSAAEEFTYNLKNLKRATIVGETTMGGAHPIVIARLHDHFSAFVPAGRAINPITKTNWEGAGVQPDVAVPEAQALKTAQLMALKKQAEANRDPVRTDQLRTLIENLQREVALPK